MKIAHIISTFPPYRGGMGNSVCYSVLEVGNLGHDNIVFTPAYDRTAVREERLSPGARVIRLRPFLSIGNAAILPQLLWKLKGLDIVHLHYPFYGTAEIVLFFILISRFFGKKPRFIMHYHMDTVGKGIKGLIFSIYKFFFLPVIARVAEKITCASLDYIRQSELGDYYKTHKEKFVQVPFGVSTADFTPGLSGRRPTILFVGGLDTQHYFKGVKELIQAFAGVAKDFPEAELVLVGKGDLESHYRRLAERSGIGERMAIENGLSNAELAVLYQQALVCVLPSINKSEAFGLVLLEAMASATPVIASNLPGVRNVFRNNEHGFLVQPGNVEDLSEKLRRILEDPARARVMGETARRWVEDNYSWQKVGQELDALYCQIMYSPPKELT